MSRLSLRYRIFLFFVALGFGALVLVIGGLWVGYSRVGGDPNGFMTAGLIAGFGIVALVTGVGYLFDENVSKPITRIAADLRTRAHAGVSGDIDQSASRYLGDLGPAAAAISEKLGADTVDTARQVAAETARLSTERAQLTAMLSEIPVAVLMLSEDHRIVLYDGQAAAALEPLKPLCLGHSVFEHLDESSVMQAVNALSPDGRRAADLSVATVDGTRVFEANIRGLGEGAGYLLTFKAEADAWTERPLVFDFDLAEDEEHKELAKTP